MTEAYVVMHRASGKGPDSQWLDFTTNFFGRATRVEWDLDTMSIAVPHDIASILVRNGYARLMTSQEREEYTLSSESGTTSKGETS